MTGSLATSVPEVGTTTATSRKADFASIFANESAFRAWYDVAAPRVYAYLLGRCGGDATLAEELTQQAFVSAIRGRGSFDGRSDPMTWIIAIARRGLVDHFRRLARDERRHLRVVVTEIARTSGTIETSWPDTDLRDDVLTALRALPAEQRAAIVLHHVDGLSVRDVAAQLGRSESAVESLLARARRRFRHLYESPDRDD